MHLKQKMPTKVACTYLYELKLRELIAMTSQNIPVNFGRVLFGRTSPIVIILLCLYAGNAAANGVPALAKIPPNIASIYPNLVNQRAQLVQERNRLHFLINQHNTNCSSVIEGSAQAEACKSEQQTLSAELGAHIQKSDSFDAQVASEIQQYDKHAINPGTLITKAEYKSAQKRLRHLQALQKKFENKIAEVRSWQKGLQRNTHDYEAMRADATRDLAWEFVNHAPVDSSLDSLKDVKALKNVNIDKIKIAYELVKGTLQSGRGVVGTQNSSQAMDIESGNRETRNALVDLSGTDQRSKALLKAISKIFDYAAKDMVISASSEASARPMSNRKKLQGVMTLVEALEPWWGLGVLGENLSERSAEYLAAKNALASLHEAQSSNWNAERYLEAKLARARFDASNTRLTINKYEMAHH